MCIFECFSRSLISQYQYLLKPVQEQAIRSL
ncbi:hypothetical protein MTR67_033936 [Solanum verrucosum]|uniref:Uncharacterized protein n=1 Tax=Solanum verrucosum TaxID=315347 RepID=A0AAF0U7D4_SOLVR|nr:hypothetical protein MTR67_033936 [Solanum verrucosum]